MSVHCLKKATLWLSFCLFVISASLFAQSDRGTVSGTVRDSTGAVIPGAKVTVTNTATNVVNSSVTNEVGEFTIPNVQVGTYAVEATKAGFRPAELKGLTVNAATNVRADIS